MWIVKTPGNRRCVVTLRWLGRTIVFACGVAGTTPLEACQVDSRYADVPKSICESGEIWTYSDKDSPQMNPGRSCVKCHADTNDIEHAPLYTVAGTVMQAEHENDDCRGVAEMTVILTDADGKEWKMPANTAGNFWLEPDAEVAMPYTARVVDGSGHERAQQEPVSDGDCASCHTRDGAHGASGRVLAPDDSDD